MLAVTLFGCSHGLQETAFAIHDDRDGVHYIVLRDQVSSRISANQPHSSGQFHCRGRYTSEEMALMRKWVHTEHTWYRDCTPISQHANHEYASTSDQSWATVWQGPLSAAILSGGLAGMAALWPEDMIINHNSASGGNGGMGMGGAGGMANGGNVSIRGYRRW